MWPQKWNASAFWARRASSTKPPPASPISSRPVRARKPRRELAPAMLSLNTERAGCVRQEALELVERADGPPRAPRAVRREDDGVGAAGPGQRFPHVGARLLVEQPQLHVGVIREPP